MCVCVRVCATSPNANRIYCHSNKSSASTSSELRSYELIGIFVTSYMRHGRFIASCRITEQVYSPTRQKHRQRI